jgi:hypothetical protein
MNSTNFMRVKRKPATALAWELKDGGFLVQEHGVYEELTKEQFHANYERIDDAEYVTINNQRIMEAF